MKGYKVAEELTYSFMGLFFKAARVGERLSPYVSLACIGMAVTILWGT
jgi:hypothetical protein